MPLGCRFAGCLVVLRVDPAADLVVRLAQGVCHCLGAIPEVEPVVCRGLVAPVAFVMLPVLEAVEAVVVAVAQMVRHHRVLLTADPTPFLSGASGPVPGC